MQVCMDLISWKCIDSLDWDKFLQILYFFQVENFYPILNIRIILLFLNFKSAHQIWFMDAVIVIVLAKFIEIIFLGEDNYTIF